jgi:hypothetical protein
MIRLCVSQCFHANKGVHPSDGPQFIRYAHSCAKDNCLTQCDAVILLTQHPEDITTAPWSLNNSTTCCSDLTWFCNQNPRTRFLLNNNVMSQTSSTGSVVDMSLVQCIDIDGNTLTPKYEPRVPVKQQVSISSQHHLKIAVKRSDETIAQLHLILCHGYELDVANWDQFEIGDDPVVFIRLCEKNNDNFKGCVYLGEVPATTHSQKTNANSQDYFMQCEWSAGIKFIQLDTIADKTTEHLCILSAIVSIELN